MIAFTFRLCAHYDKLPSSHPKSSVRGLQHRLCLGRFLLCHLRQGLHGHCGGPHLITLPLGLFGDTSALSCSFIRASMPDGSPSMGLGDHGGEIGDPTREDQPWTGPTPTDGAIIKARHQHQRALRQGGMPHLRRPYKS